MKATTEQHIKFKRLQMKLGGLPLWQAKGLLESLWNLCATSTPCGNIGKFSNEDICASIEWSDDPDELINILIDCGWMDSCTEQRLIIHNWNMHCPTYIKGNLAKHNKSFFTPKQLTKQPAKQSACDGATKPILSKPSQAKSENTFVEQARHVFDFWKSTMESERSMFSDERQKVICKCLKNGYTQNQLKMAVAGCSLTDHNMGRGEGSNGQKYNGINLILRNSDNIDRFIATYEARNG